jgi:hypothetical protein
MSSSSKSTTPSAGAGKSARTDYTAPKDSFEPAGMGASGGKVGTGPSMVPADSAYGKKLAERRARKGK